MQKNTLISVIIPCFNVEAYIEECLESVFQQSYPSIEIICVDNNSSDNTLNILNKLGTRNPKIKICTEIKRGANATRNKGLESSKGEWIQFLDADDLINPEKISKQMQLVSNHPGVNLIAGAYLKRTILNSETVFQPKRLESPILNVFTNQAGITSSNLWQRQALLDVNGWDESLKSSQETDLMLRILYLGGDLVIDPNVNTIIRERESGQISQGDPSARIERYIQTRLNHMLLIRQYKPNDFDKYKSLFYDYLVVSTLELFDWDAQKAQKIFESFRPNWVSSNFFGLSKFKVYFIKTLGIKNYKLLAKLFSVLFLAVNFLSYFRSSIKNLLNRGQ